MQQNSGDMTIDMVFAWLRAGAKLDSLTGVTVLAFVLRLFLVPALEGISTKAGKLLCGKNILYAALLTSIILVVLVNFLTKSHLSVLLIIGISVAVTWQAVGIHQTGKQMSKPSDDSAVTTSAAS